MKKFKKLGALLLAAFVSVSSLSAGTVTAKASDMDERAGGAQQIELWMVDDNPVSAEINCNVDLWGHRHNFTLGPATGTPVPNYSAWELTNVKGSGTQTITATEPGKIGIYCLGIKIADVTVREYQDVYIYTEFVGAIPDDAVINDSNYYTIGKMRLPIKENPKNVGEKNNIFNKYADVINSAEIERFEANKNISLDKMKWNQLVAVPTGANDYVEKGWTWHLDGEIDLDWFQVTYDDGVDGDYLLVDGQPVSTKTYSNYEGGKLPLYDKEFNRPGYTFAGWYTEKDGQGSKLDPTSTINADVTYYANWVENHEETKEVEYTVNHVVNGKVEKTDTVTAAVWVNDNTLPVQDVVLYDFEGYKYDSNSANLSLNEDKSALVGSGTIEENGTITVNYVKDEEQVKEYSYAVQHIVNGEVKDEDKVYYQTWVNDEPLTSLTVEPVHYREYEGYTLDEVATIVPETVDVNGVVKVYYEEDKVSTNPLNPDSADQVPDKYQVEVKFDVVNGTTSLDRTFVTKVDGEGNYALDGMGHLTLSQLAVLTADKGYDQESLTWSPVEPTTTLDITENVTFEGVFEKAAFTLTVNYIDEDGNTLADSVVKDVLFGDSYSVESPVVDGYSLKDEGQLSVAGVMAADSLTVDVVYVKDAEPEVPVVPEQPSEPTDPEVPTVPEEPVTPEVPSVPETPTVPEEPVTPEVPAEPETPARSEVVTPVSPVTPDEPELPTEDVEDQKTPQGVVEDVEDQKTPLSTVGGNWALVNLILAGLSVVLGIVLLLSKNSKEDEDVEMKRSMLAKGLGVVVAALSVVVFFLTEDLSLSMTLVDKWTFLMAVLALVQVVVLVVGRKFKASAKSKEVME